MLHCTDCVFGSFEQNEKTGRWRGVCKRGYVLANPHDLRGPDLYFADTADELVPITDPLGKEYLRTKDICDKYVHLSDVDKAERGRGGILRFLLHRKNRDED